jgi:hypothetical protein
MLIVKIIGPGIQELTVWCNDLPHYFKVTEALKDGYKFNVFTGKLPTDAIRFLDGIWCQAPQTLKMISFLAPG